MAGHLEPRRPAARNPCHGTAQQRQDPGRHRTVAHAFPLPPGHGLQRGELLGLSGTVGAPLSPARGDPDPGQRFLPQGCRGLGLVPVQPSLAGSPPAAAVLAAVQSHRAALAAHAPHGNSPSLFGERSRTGCHAEKSLRRDAVTPCRHSLLPTTFLLTLYAPLFMRTCIADADELNVNSILMPASWRGKTNVSAPASRPVTLRFKLRNCKLYAFQLVKKPSAQAVMITREDPWCISSGLSDGPLVGTESTLDSTGSRWMKLKSTSVRARSPRCDRTRRPNPAKAAPKSPHRAMPSRRNEK